MLALAVGELVTATAHLSAAGLAGAAAWLGPGWWASAAASARSVAWSLLAGIWLRGALVEGGLARPKQQVKGFCEGGHAEGDW